ncbi:acyl-coenzyme A diphosphatase NUDT19-like [Achroia grisella]|uniref:acyl-coenzyme A diphosphatase NUDT19-like n=1 Tax=Achroia grisella TaxID=688607 RepID=UPI0027D2BD1B|nr:acyl-coenzyme A diphosphatase NUDT19-like [Achroia grisella]
MKTVVQRGWRNASSLIVLNKRYGDLTRAPVNYDILLQTRPSTGAFPNGVVFPGGVTEPADDSEQWLKLFKSFGYSDEDFATFYSTGTPTTLFQPNPILRHIALRITAIRETFEEVGLLLCSRDFKSNRNSFYASVLDVDTKFWQKEISKNPEQLLNLCKEYNCYPDIWSLFYWSQWMTPCNFRRRFDTAFFVTTLQHRPEKLKCSSEVTKVQWDNPTDIFKKNIQLELELHPPQAYEILRLAHIPDIDDLTKFGAKRNKHNIDVIYPIDIIAKDGTILVYPGDDLYPSSLDYYNDAINCEDKTVLQLREETSVIHRLEKLHAEKKSMLIFKNYKQNNHINMGDKLLEFYYNETNKV